MGGTADKAAADTAATGEDKEMEESDMQQLTWKSAKQVSVVASRCAGDPSLTNTLSMGFAATLLGGAQF